MYAVKDSSGKVSAYEGFTVQFIKYLAQHFSLRFYITFINIHPKKLGVL